MIEPCDSGHLLARLLPGLRQFDGYDRTRLRADVLAGATVAAYLVSQVTAYATVAGLPPVVGLWAAIGPLAVYVLLGTSRQLSVGPESTTALMTAVALAPLRPVIRIDTRHWQRCSPCWWARCVWRGAVAQLGVLADLLSKPVLVGYLAGTAVIMIVGQLGRMTGISVEGEPIPAQLHSLVSDFAGRSRGL
ncbi:SulP family inorganic anion transporter [Nocardia sp. NPDC051990]|uniref:SulP family inorganic anion transporter n=1 Tax=Nocardia sp. NPDC051990 TaxID=3155285 RepID=UPI003437A43F